jgi:uncharacterized membrane protein
MESKTIMHLRLYLSRYFCRNTEIMAFFIGLVIMYLLTWLLTFLPFADGLKGLEGLIAASIMFTLVGLSHFLKPAKLEAMIPERWPYKRAINYISGAAEMLLGVLLLFASTRYYASLGLILLLVAVFPANINVAITRPNGYNISRLFFQPVYIAWIYWFCIAKKQLLNFV